MTHGPIFRGAATALITPLDERGIDFDRLGCLIDWQIDEGIDALVICGTTGEASTLTDKEHRDAIAYAVERTNAASPSSPVPAPTTPLTPSSSPASPARPARTPAWWSPPTIIRPRRTA